MLLHVHLAFFAFNCKTAAKESTRVKKTFAKIIVNIFHSFLFDPKPTMAGLTESEVSDLRKEFSSFNAEKHGKDGTISAKELASVLKSFGDDDDVVHRVIDTFDVDGDGTIMFNEFLIMMARKESNAVVDSKGGKRNIQELIRKALARRQEIRKSFKSFDKVVAVVKYY